MVYVKTGGLRSKPVAPRKQRKNDDTRGTSLNTRSVFQCVMGMHSEPPMSGFVNHGTAFHALAVYQDAIGRISLAN